MAPFGRGGTSSYKRDSRGGQKFSRGGPVRSRSGSARNGKKPPTNRERTFYPTRIEETVQEDNDLEQEQAEQQIDESDGQSIEASDHTDDSDDEVPTKATQPYSFLLQSLSANVQQNEPQRKRRRLENEKPLVAKETMDQDVAEVEEPEDVEDLEAGDEDEGDELEENHDPFTQHFSDQDEARLAQSIQGLGDRKGVQTKLVKAEGWSSIFEGPSDRPGAPTTGGQSRSIDVKGPHIKQKLKDSAFRLLPQLGHVEAHVASTVLDYKDILFPQRTLDNAKNLRKLSCLHLLNHVLKTRDKVIKNNDRLAKHDSSEDLELRDQGFTRPKVLILLPTRNACARYVDTIVAMLELEQQENKKRFQDSFANGDDNFAPGKPADFQDLFAGNDDDMFRLGMKLTRKAVKFFSPFYNSDIIFASPLGLRMAIDGDDPKKKDNDFLSSIEIVLLDQADAMAMQNWEHIEYIFEHLNLQPRETRDCDFSRVRYSYLNNQAKFLRQTIMLSAFNFPALNKMYTKSLVNVAGKVKYHKKVEGAIVKIGSLSQQTFSRFNCKDPSSEPDDRFAYFSTTIVPSLTRSHLESKKGILIFIPSYADFVRVRNYFASSAETENISFGSISEYTSSRDVARARSHFQSGRHSVLLYTERAHHFRRYHLQGVKAVILYALPDNPVFYEEIVGGFLQASIAAGKVSGREASARLLFSPLDVLKLERIVGSSRFVSMIRDVGDTFVFE